MTDNRLRSPETERKAKWRRSKGRSYADRLNAIVKNYQKTFQGWMALRTGQINTRAKLRGAEGRLSMGDLVGLWAKQNRIDSEFGVICAHCQKKTTDWSADHIIPIKDGGEHSARNLQLLCAGCHKAKTRSDRDPFDRDQSMLNLMYDEDRSYPMLPCPFCGSAPTIVHREDTEGVDIRCLNPDCILHYGLDLWMGEPEMVQAWNRRIAKASGEDSEV